MTGAQGTSKQESLLASFIYRSAMNLAFWIVTILFVVWGVPWLGTVLYKLQTTPEPFDFSAIVDLRVWVIQLIGAFLTIGIIHFLASSADVKARDSFVGFVAEDLFAVLLSYGSVSLGLFACAIPAPELLKNASWHNLLYFAVNYSMCLRIWYMTKGFKKGDI